MKLGLLGVGGAGGRIVEAIRSTEKSSGQSMTDGNILVFDTDRSALEALSKIPEDQRVLVGETDDSVAGEGVNGDPELAATVANADDHEMHRSFDDLPIEDLDGLIVAAGIGGGTGAGVGAVLVEQCTAIFDGPVYALVALPHAEESETVSLNAARALQSFVRLADNVITFDNNAWVDSLEADEPFANVNDVIVERTLAVLSLGDFDGTVAEKRVDRTDIIRTLEPGGITSIGMASTSIAMGWRRWFRWLPWVGLPDRDAQNDAMRLKQLVRRAVESTLSIECDITSTERALIVIAGPPEVISRKGFESARYWLEKETETVEIISGDEPDRRNTTLRAVVLLSNVTDVPRIDELQESGLTAVRAVED